MDDAWKELVNEAKLKDFKLQAVKKHFAVETKKDVVEFKKELAEVHREYIKSGPGAASTNLDDGNIINFLK